MDVIVCAPILRNNNLMYIAFKTRPKQSFVIPVRCRFSYRTFIIIIIIYLSTVYLLNNFFLLTCRVIEWCSTPNGVSIIYALVVYYH